MGSQLTDWFEEEAVLTQNDPRTMQSRLSGPIYDSILTLQHRAEIAYFVQQKPNPGLSKSFLSKYHERPEVTT